MFFKVILNSWAETQGWPQTPRQLSLSPTPVLGESESLPIGLDVKLLDIIIFSGPYLPTSLTVIPEDRSVVVIISNRRDSDDHEPHPQEYKDRRTDDYPGRKATTMTDYQPLLLPFLH